MKLKEDICFCIRLLQYGVFVEVDEDIRPCPDNVVSWKGGFGGLFRCCELTCDATPEPDEQSLLTGGPQRAVWSHTSALLVLRCVRATGRSRVEWTFLKFVIIIF